MIELTPVVVESPYAARFSDGAWDASGVEANLTYLRAAMADCLKKGEAPYASHALYTQPGVLDDQIPEERQLGISAGFTWNQFAARSVVYIDRGLSTGMRDGLLNAKAACRPVYFRMLGPVWQNQEGSRLISFAWGPTAPTNISVVDNLLRNFK